VPSENTEQRKLAAIMFTDMVGYSALSQRNEALALELLAENQRLLRTQFPLFNGREVKTTGDGFLIEFPSALQGTQCAVEIQRAVVARNATQPAERHVQTEVAQQVVQMLQVKLGVEAARALAKSPTENPEAHRLYLLGRYHFGKSTEASLTNAMQYFTHALQLDPSYALAYCGLADCYGWVGGALLSGKEAWAKEKELAQKALALDPNLADAHLSLGIALASAFDWNGGEQEIKRALELNPKLALAYDQLAWVQMQFGRFDEAIRNKQKAIELDPLSLMFNSALGGVLATARRYDEAMAQLRKTLELDPNYANAHTGLGWCSVRKGDTTGAIAEFQKAMALDPHAYSEGTLAYAYARAGDRTKAEQMLRDWVGLAKQRYISPGPRVYLHLGLGEKDKALDWLEKCYEEQDGYCWGLKVYPDFDPVRTEPRFQVLLKKVGLDR
jgi:tetratricopeptide (TPR) repeat protein